MIKKQKNKWYLYSKDGSKKLGGPYDSRDGAVKRERQVQYFKHVKSAAFKKEAVLLQNSSHFWEKLFSKPKTKQEAFKIEQIFKRIGEGGSGIEEIPSLKGLLLEKNKYFMFQEAPSKPKYIFKINKNPETDKHYFVLVSGSNKEIPQNNIKDITSLIQRLSSSSGGF